MAPNFKNLILLIVFVTCSTSFRISKEAAEVIDFLQYTNNLEFYDLKGKVAKVSYLTSNYSYSFNRNGYVSKLEYLNPRRGSPIYYKYNKHGKLLEAKEINSDGDVTSLETRKYNKEGNLIYEIKNSNFKNYIKKHFYNERSRSVEIYIYDLNEDYKSSKVIEYNADGMPSNIKYFSSRLLLPKSIKFSYQDTAYSERHFEGEVLAGHLVFYNNREGLRGGQKVIKGLKYDSSYELIYGEDKKLDTMRFFDRNGNIKSFTHWKREGVDRFGNTKKETSQKIIFRKGKSKVLEPYTEVYEYEYYE